MSLEQKEFIGLICDDAVLNNLEIIVRISYDSLNGELREQKDDNSFTIEHKRFNLKYLSESFEGSDLYETDKFELDKYSSIIVSGEKNIKSALINNNFLTPIIYVDFPEEIKKIKQDLSDEEFKKKYNLYEFYEWPEKLFTNLSNNLKITLREAIIKKRELRVHAGGLDNLLNLIPEKIPSPKFNSVYNQFCNDETKLTKYWNSLIPEIKQRHDAILDRIKIDDDTNAKNLFKKTFSDAWQVKVIELNLEKSSFLDILYREYNKSNKNLIKVLGNFEIGEGGVGLPEKDFLYSGIVFRFEKEKLGYNPYKIALQKFIDIERFKNTKFKVPSMSFPISYSYEGEELCFVAMEYIRGIPLNEVLDVINKKIDKGKYQYLEQLKTFRSKLVEKTMDDLTFWTNNAGSTFIPKPSAEEMKDFYKYKLSNLLYNLEETTLLEFSDSEKEKYSRFLEIFDHLKIGPECIVRNRDAVFNNNILVSSAKDDDEQQINLEILLSEFIFKKRDKDSSIIQKDDSNKREILSEAKIAEKINEKFFNVDLNYRYCHILENAAQILTMYEAEFLWKKEETYALNEPNKYIKRFLSNVQEKKCLDLFDDKNSLNLMYFYRSTRKLSLFCEYWKTHLYKTEGKFDEKIRQRFVSNMLHYAKLSRFCIDRLKTGFKSYENVEIFLDIEYVFERIRTKIENYEHDFLIVKK